MRCLFFMLTFLPATPLATIYAAEASKPPAAAETDARLHADGKGWRLDMAKITDPKRPRVLLIGDSILNGYLPLVTKTLEGKACVDAWVNPYCQSEHLNKLLAEVLAHGPYDVVHFNMGLHGWQEGRIKPGTFEPLTRAYIEVLKTRLPNAKLIWASSTPVTVQGKPTELEPHINPIIVEHNRMAAKVMAEMNVPLNDFYALLVNKRELARGDRFHWTTPAYALLADAAVGSILQALPAKPNNTATTALELQSPNGDFRLTFDVKHGTLFYRVAYQGKPVIAESRLGLELADAALDGLAVAGSQVGHHDETWKPVYGERSAVRDHYNELSVDLTQLRLTFRAYDEGVAFCYTVPKLPGRDEVVIEKEFSEFRFLADHTTWETHAAQGVYKQTTVSQIKKGCERPVVLQAADDLFIAVAEAKLVDYARMKLAPLAANAIVSDLSGPVTSTLPLTTPWRVVMAAATPGRLLENNFILLNLNDPCAIADTSWIKPGKVIREVTLTTTGGKACVDFAVRRGLQYVEFDAGWYGAESDPKSDASAVNLDPKRSKGPLDLDEVIRYGQQWGIGIILYVNHQAAERQLDQILPLYQKWGIKGVKYGFVNVGPQQWTHWLHHAIRRAADHKLMVDVHDEYRPTGYSRTYPNLMTVEGISGDETKPSNRQTLTLQFMRLLAGPADNTICYYDARVDQNATHAYQLAKAVCLYSPWQFLYWYDRPPGSPQKTAGAGGAAPVLGEEPELEFFDHVPTVWDDTKIIHGRVGEYVVVARRSGASWFIGAMNSGQERTLDVPLGFLDAGKKYTACIYADDPTVPTQTHVKIERRLVTAGIVLQIAMSAQGGQAIRIVP
jgi:alpha-glucosidase